ncbi:hypothetical protein ICW40_10115 [Actinotalea ferrariae]|uniref:hypothetical protein n=1 Tax=Actinotalea ferrariae TaxID=1386098 RepID=UPI001C8C902E|nr:hypothetical protein [Actinotalea ferrariae]MBX9245160.1 hypothetical protein [Actinotalea ferrariae]
MPTRLLLDGEDLRSLMLRVKAEMGPGARIVKAERIRTGGIGGFFAKEHYELTVEVPDPVHPGRRIQERNASAGTTSAPVGIEALLAAADAAEDADATSAVTAPGASGGAPAVPGTSGSAVAGADAVAAAAAAARAQQVPAAPETPEISTTGPTFAEVLESLGQLVGDDVQLTSAGTAHGGTDVEVTEVEVTDVEVTDVEVTDVGFTDVEPAGTEVARLEPGAAGSAAPTDADPHGATVGALLELGLPTSLLAGLGDLRAAVPLSTLVRRFPPAPVLRLDTGVIAVVGEPAAALRTAMQMAYRAGIDPHDVVLAGDMDAVPGHGRRIQTTVAAARLRGRAGDGATLVAVGVDASGRPAAAELLEALAPDQCWAVVDASRRVAETRRWLREVGVRRGFDAVAAMGSFEAQSPGSVLNVGVPVGWVDGLPASPVVWAAVLSERLAEDARWD